VVGRNAYPWWRCPKMSLLFENVGVDKHVNGVKDDETEEYTLVRWDSFKKIDEINSRQVSINSE
jgi:hypothetical protein